MSETKIDYEGAARDAYGIWRGSQRGEIFPPHWDDLLPWVRDAMIGIAELSIRAARSLPNRKEQT